MADVHFKTIWAMFGTKKENCKRIFIFSMFTFYYALLHPDQLNSVFEIIFSWCTLMTCVEATSLSSKKSTYLSNTALSISNLKLQ